MMGGDVTVTSEPGKGSVFTVRLPSDAPLTSTVGTSICGARARAEWSRPDSSAPFIAARGRESANGKKLLSEGPILIIYTIAKG
jgi:hypothetical protein